MSEIVTRQKQSRTAFCLSLGCAKNRVDSERVVGVLSEAGCEMTDSAEGADICIVNTCGFLNSAVKENIDAILALANLRNEGRTCWIGVFGCLVNRYGDELRDNIPEVDFWARCEDYSALRQALGLPASRMNPVRKRLPGHPRHTRYLKLAEGCDNNCSYCAIPGIRGGLRSLTAGALVEEANELVCDGAREICLVAQDLTAYGSDLAERTDLYELLDALESSLPRDVWLRLLYLHPGRVTSRLLERVAGGRQIQPYLDIPIQHASPCILAAMNRPADRNGLISVFETAREIRGDFALRTTCMVGFPAESRQDFQELLRFLERVRFDKVGAFAYSPEEGTPAAAWGGQIAARTKRARLERLQSHVEELSRERQQLFVGKTMELMIDEICGDALVCRSFREAPDVDGTIDVTGVRGAFGHEIGGRLFARIESAYEHDMLAVEVAEACVNEN